MSDALRKRRIKQRSVDCVYGIIMSIQLYLHMETTAEIQCHIIDATAGLHL
jgi:hypothetical protein